MKDSRWGGIPGGKDFQVERFPDDKDFQVIRISQGEGFPGGKNLLVEKMFTFITKLFLAILRAYKSSKNFLPAAGIMMHDCTKWGPV